MRDKAIVFEAGEGKLLSARGSTMSFKATRASTNGAFSFMERTLPPRGREPPPHIHTNCEEAFYVLEGEIEFSLDEDTVIGRPGSFVHVPGGRVAYLRQRSGSVVAPADHSCAGHGHLL